MKIPPAVLLVSLVLSAHAIAAKPKLPAASAIARSPEVDNAVAELYQAAAQVYEAAAALDLATATAKTVNFQGQSAEVQELSFSTAPGGAVALTGAPDEAAALLDVIQPLGADGAQAAPGRRLQEYFSAALRLRGAFVEAGLPAKAVSGLDAGLRTCAAMRAVMTQLAKCPAKKGRAGPLCWEDARGGTGFLARYDLFARNRVASDFAQVERIYKTAAALVAGPDKQHPKAIKTLLEELSRLREQASQARQRQAMQGLDAGVDMALGHAGLNDLQRLWNDKQGDAAWRQGDAGVKVQAALGAAAVYAGGEAVAVGDGAIIAYKTKAGQPIYAAPIGATTGIDDSRRGELIAGITDKILKGDGLGAKIDAALAAVRGAPGPVPNPGAARGGPPAAEQVRAGAERGSILPRGCADQDRYQGFADEQLGAVQEQAAGYARSAVDKERWAQEQCARLSRQKGLALKSFDDKEADAISDLGRRDAARAARGKAYDDRCEAVRDQAAIELAKLAKAGQGPGAEDPRIWTQDRMQATVAILQQAYDQDLRGLLPAVRRSYGPGGSRNARLAQEAGVHESYMAGPSGGAVVKAFFKDYGSERDLAECRVAHDFSVDNIIPSGRPPLARLVTPTADTVAERCVRWKLTAYVGSQDNRDQAYVPDDTGLPKAPPEAMDDEARKIRAQMDRRRM